jgi:hypothetical protein
MSLGIYPVFHPKLKGTAFKSIGEVLASNFETLDRIAHRAKLRPFTAFADTREIPDDFDGDPDELAEIMGEWTEWFDPADGRVAIQALADYIKTNPKATKKLDGAASTVEELEELVRVLVVAETEGVRFRLEMS